MATTIDTDDKATMDEITLEVEEVEEVIAPKITVNHNETFVSE